MLNVILICIALRGINNRLFAASDKIVCVTKFSLLGSVPRPLSLSVLSTHGRKCGIIGRKISRGNARRQRTCPLRMTTATSARESVYTVEVSDCDLDEIFDCGQCFRWDRNNDGSWSGVAHGRTLRAAMQGGTLMLYGVDKAEFEGIWHEYFDLGRDYGAVKRRLSADPVLAKAAEYSPGIRILRQEPWETLCSFIISQNNNIPRIKGIISRLCENFGEDIGGAYSFPSAETIARLMPGDLAPLRCGFREKYILDAARRVASGEIDLAALGNMPLTQARQTLETIKGVGPKVADCTLLFGCGRIECFPVDVWIKRVLACFYPGGFPEEYMPFGGIAQQYLFNYARSCPECGLN